MRLRMALVSLVMSLIKLGGGRGGLHLIKHTTYGKLATT